MQYNKLWIIFPIAQNGSKWSIKRKKLLDSASKVSIH